MGAEYLIQLDKAAAVQRVKRWYRRLPENGRVSLVLNPDINVDKVTSWIWIEFPVRCLRCKNAIELGYSFGGQGLNGEVAIAVGAEIMKRVKAKRWGWDSVGWCSAAEMKANGVPRPFGAEIRRRKEFAQEHPIKAKMYDELAGDVTLLEKTQKQLEEWAAKFFEETWK